MPDLDRTKTHRKHIFWSLGLFQTGPQQKIVQSNSFKTKIDLVDPEL